MLERERRKLIVYLLPALAVYTLFFTYPALQAPYVALTKWDGITPPEYVGLSNFSDLVSNPSWWNAVKNTGFYAVLHLVLGLALGLLFAVAVRSLPRWRKSVQFVIFAPTVLSSAVVALLWLFIYNPVFGLLNGVLRGIGLDSLAIAWLGNDTTALPAITVASVWAGVGGTMILFMAGLQKIPQDFYDAAAIDGANDWQLFVNITWPLLWEITRILIILAIIGGLQAFGLFYVIAGGFTRPGTDVTGTFIYRTAFVENRYGYATAVGVVLFLIILALTYVSNNLLSRRESVEY